MYNCFVFETSAKVKKLALLLELTRHRWPQQWNFLDHMMLSRNSVTGANFTNK